MGRCEHSNFERALDLIIRLQAGQRLSLNKLCEIYSISYRQTLRLVNSAVSVLPVIREKRNGEIFLRWCNHAK
ncbi:hypothetical protein KI809_18855 [Geobacter pelophilus]|uniref:HTH domain-containing protein n=1 Tax=Geoanaerobacter pelophilus TaxID=60036 RepID=A0AAW4L645_9BACT|nr:helix-turn-helix domain-containing protein [Geoanaerobacter pelophilus]MBT0666373.1 hypothetical protein [Geoanaerobacter pelophilus]